MPNPEPSALHIQLGYEVADTCTAQSGAELANPLFELLHAVETEGSIKGASECLGLSYRHVWGAIKRWETVLGRELVVWRKGRRASLTPYAQRLVWVERQARSRMIPHLEALRAELQQMFREAEDESLQMLEVAASHDLAVNRMRHIAAEQARLHMKLRFTGSEQALRDLNEGACRLAGFHVPRLEQASSVFRAALSPHLQPGEHKLISCHRRVQGWMFRRSEGPDPAPTGWHRLATPGTRFVNRQPGSGTRLLLDHLLQERGISSDTLDGYTHRIEHTHVATAARIAGGTADLGLGVEAAARDFGLDFEPLVEEDYYLVCLKSELDSPPIQRLRTLLGEAAWASQLQGLPGHAAQHPGQVLSLVQALPWWRFDDQPRKTVKARAAAAAPRTHHTQDGMPAD